MNNIKIGIFDDHPLIIKGLADFIISQKIEVVFCSDNKKDLFENLKTFQVDIMLLDIVAPDVFGLELFEQIAKKYPQIKCIAYSTLSSVMLVENLLNIEVKGFVNKKQPAQDIVTAIQDVYKNEISIPKEYYFLSSKYHSHTNNTLTTREIEIVVLISKEFTSTEIAEKLSLSTFTIENHRKSIFKKLEVKNLAGMIMVASRLGYIS
jgi:DNA-binding NarL/FixJ family response regulator